MDEDVTALEELAHRLWDERRIVTCLLFELTVTRLLLASDERRFVPHALREADRTVELLREGEQGREAALRDLAARWHVDPSRLPLGELARLAPPPYDHVFADHATAIGELTAEIDEVSRANRMLARSGLDGVAPMRATSETMVLRSLDRLRTCLEAYERSRSQLGTGRRMLAPSDDPASGPSVVHDGTPWVSDGDVVTRRVSDTELVRIDVTAAESLDLDVPGQHDLLTLLEDVATAVETDPAPTTAEPDALRAASSRIGDHLGIAGTATDRVGSARSRAEELSSTLRTELTEVQDVDVARGAMELQVQQVAYEATLQALAKALPPSLVAFLR